MWVNRWSSKIYLTIDLRDRIKTLCAFVIEDKMILPRWNKYRKFSNYDNSQWLFLKEKSFSFIKLHNLYFSNLQISCFMTIFQCFPDRNNWLNILTDIIAWMLWSFLIFFFWSILIFHFVLFLISVYIFCTFTIPFNILTKIVRKLFDCNGKLHQVVCFIDWIKSLLFNNWN